MPFASRLSSHHLDASLTLDVLRVPMVSYPLTPWLCDPLMGIVVGRGCAAAPVVGTAPACLVAAAACAAALWIIAWPRPALPWLEAAVLGQLLIGVWLVNAPKRRVSA